MSRPREGGRGRVSVGGASLAGVGSAAAVMVVVAGPPKISATDSFCSVECDLNSVPRV